MKTTNEIAANLAQHRAEHAANRALRPPTSDFEQFTKYEAGGLLYDAQALAGLSRQLHREATKAKQMSRQLIELAGGLECLVKS